MFTAIRIKIVCVAVFRDPSNPLLSLLFVAFVSFLLDLRDGLGRLVGRLKSENPPYLPALGRRDGSRPPRHPIAPSALIVRPQSRRVGRVSPLRAVLWHAAARRGLTRPTRRD